MSAFFICVHGDHGLVGRLGRGRAGRNVLELGIAVGMRGPACHHLAGRLEAEAGRVQQAAHGGGTDGVACCCRAAANCGQLLHVHRNGDSGSPRVVGSTKASNAAASVGSSAVKALRPPPGRRCRPAGGNRAGWVKSARPRRIVARSSPVTSATTAIPPRPSASPRRRPPSGGSVRYTPHSRPPSVCECRPPPRPSDSAS